MHVQKLLTLLAQPTKLSKEDIRDLESVIEAYPYFYLAHALLAKANYTKEEDVEKVVVQRAAIYAIDRSYLRKWLENKLSLPPIGKNIYAKSCQETAGMANNYLELIAKKSVKKSTNENSIKQFSIIDGILNKNLEFEPLLETIPVKEEICIDLSAQRTTLDDRFSTETLAKIMVEQKKYKRAIEIYNHLMVKHPEKKSYIEAIISSLNSNF